MMTLSVSSRALRADIDPTTGGIVGVRHLRRDLTLVSRAVDAPPFRLELDAHESIATYREARVEARAGAVRTTWTTDHGITIVGEVTSRGADLCFTVAAHNTGTATIRRLTYPVLPGIGRIGGVGRDELAHSHGTGMLFHDPLDLLDADPDNRRKLRFSPYPEGFAGATMQFLAYYARGLGGFFFGTEDGGCSMKWLNVEREASGLALTVIHKPDTPAPGVDLTPAYPVVLAPLDRGTWYEAGDRYRTWALQQAWARPGPRSRWLREDVGICTFGINARHDRSAWLDAIHAMAGTPVFHVLGPNWPAYGQDYRGHLPRDSRDWFPAVFAAENLAAIRRNGDRWAPFEFDLLCSDPADDAEPVLASRYAMDAEESGISDRGLPGFPFMCPATAYWHDHHVARDARIVRDHDADALYYDISVNNVLLQCYAQGHDHAPGAGTALADAFTAMYRDTNAATALVRDDHVPAGAEMISEQFLPVFDFYQARGESGPYAPFEVGAFRDLILDGRAEKIPLFAYVYGPRAPVRMDGWAKLSAESGDLFYWTAATVLLNGGLFEVNGEFSALEVLDDGRWDDPAEHYYPFSDRRYAVDPAKAAYLGTVARARVGPANPFLAGGSMVPAPSVEAPDIDFSYFAYNMSTTEAAFEDRGSMTVPSVLATGWQTGGRTAWIAANLAPEVRTARIDGRLITLDPREIRLIEA